MGGFPAIAPGLPVGKPGINDFLLPQGIGSNGFTHVMTVGTVHWMPIEIPFSMQIDRIGLNVTGTGGIGSVIRLGIRNDNGSGKPGSLLLDAGTIDGTSGTNQMITISQLLGPGLYWLGACAQVGTSPTVSVLRGSLPGISGPVQPSTNGISSLLETGVAGAFGTVAPTISSADPDSPIVYIRRSA